MSRWKVTGNHSTKHVFQDREHAHGSSDDIYFPIYRKNYRSISLITNTLCPIRHFEKKKGSTVFPLYYWLIAKSSYWNLFNIEQYDFFYYGQLHIMVRYVCICRVPELNSITPNRFEKILIQYYFTFVISLQNLILFTCALSRYVFFFSYGRCRCISSYFNSFFLWYVV